MTGKIVRASLENSLNEKADTSPGETGFRMTVRSFLQIKTPALVRRFRTFCSKRLAA
jgi:hypothetical protein